MNDYEAQAIPLERDAGILSFDASISGKDEDYEKLSEKEMEITEFYSDKNKFAILEEFKNSGQISDPLLKRQLKVLYDEFLDSKLDKNKLDAMTILGNKISQEFNTYRVELDGKQLTDNEVEEILADSTDSNELEAIWVSSKKIGPVVSDQIIKLVKMRNETARDLGFNNYHEMSLIMNEQDPAEISAIFDELDRQTRAEYEKLKDKIDNSLSQRYGVPKNELMPWHYQNRFFQAAPESVYSINLNEYFSDQNLVKITDDYYESMGMPIDDIMQKSDLYEKPGKYQHAYMTDIDRNGDIRTVLNIKPDQYWMATMLHEFGHTVNFKYIDRNLPWSLRGMDTALTEAIAIMFEEKVMHPDWIATATGKPKENLEKIKSNTESYLRANNLVFSRWTQVMYRFEKSMYENPDQNLNDLWWELVEEYQLVKKPAGRNEPDWASKIHIATAPAYYHNYMLAKLLVPQLQSHIAETVITNADENSEIFYSRKDIGNYLVKEFFAYGISLPWDEIIEKSTGEELNIKYFAKSVKGN